jgi:hypothetical protein
MVVAAGHDEDRQRSKHLRALIAALLIHDAATSFGKVTVNTEVKSRNEMASVATQKQVMRALKHHYTRTT